MQIQWTCQINSPDHRHDYTIPAAVPGCVHTDLLRAGLIRDPFWRDNNEQLQWIEDCDVTYTGTFTLAETAPDTHLVFRGLDVYADISCNGQYLGKADNMHLSWDFDVSDVLKTGENILTVAFYSPVRAVAGRPARSAAFTAERLYTRRIQCSYGWDWVGRFVTMGIWKPVELVQRHADDIGCRADGIYVYTRNVNPYCAQVGVELSFARVTGDAWVRMTVTDPEGRAVWSKTRRILLPVITETVDIPAPQLWYPAGYGEQPLYTLTAEVWSGEIVGEARDVRTQTFGIRTVKILEIEDAPDSREAALAQTLKETPHLQEWDRNDGSSCFWLLVNDVRVFCKGANWVPCEPFASAETPEKITRLVQLARDAGVNMLRVWGGGIFEHDAFYDACDRAGVMVTQDFLMACGHYPEEDAAFLEQLRRETREAALRLRNHASLVWWSGDNENAINGDENSAHYNGRAAALEAIGPVLAELDPHRRFLPSSPYGGVPYASGVRGTSHNTQYLGNFFAWVRENDWENYREHFDTYLNRFTAEHPAIGMPFVSSLRRFLTDEDIFGDDTAMSEYHTKNNPGLGEITLYGYVERLAQGIFGTFTDGADRVKKMQWLHCEWIRLSLELFRRHAWYSAGLLYWMWNDCWPAANGWSMVDYYGCPKPGYYAFKRAAKQVLASIQLADEVTGALCTRVYVSHNGAPGEQVCGECRLYRYDIVTGQEETVATVPFAVPANSAAVIWEGGEIALSESTVLIADVTSVCGGDRAFSLPAHTRYADMPFADAQPQILAQTEEYVEVMATETIPFALVDTDGVVLEENGAFLKKGERRRYRVARQ